MERYKWYSFSATVLVALFIINFAFCVLCMNKTIYERCLDHGSERAASEVSISIEDFEARANFDKLNDDFKSFFRGRYELIGYELDEFNVDRLNHIKGWYRLAWVVTVASCIGMVYCFIVLSKRRMFMPLIYGGVLAAFFTAVNALIFIRSDKESLVAARAMVFRGDYSWFSDKDILLQMMPADYARWMAIAYLAMVAVLILIMILIRWFILYLGRPHKF